MRILSFGSKKYVFLAQLYACLKKHDPKLAVDCISLKDRSGKKVNDQQVFDDVVKPRFSFGSVLYLITSFHRLLLGLLSSMAIFLLSPREGIRSFGFVVGNFFKIALLQHALGKYSVIHVHYCTARNMAGVCFLPRRIPIVCTYWGSDLFRHQGVAYNYWSRKALERADAITVSSPEMRETILSEFGRTLKPKIEYVLLIPEFRLVGLIDEVRDNEAEVAGFRKRLGIQDDAKVVCVGNNAIGSNNHLPILSQLENCAGDFESVCFVLPLTYGRKEKYCRELEAFCAKSPLRTCLLNEYMSWEDLALLRVATDVMIMMPESDAMSGALTEAMYAGSVAITGSWLPYGRFRSAGCVFEAVDRFEEIPAKLRNILSRPEHFSPAAAGNRECLRNAYYNEPALAKAWLDAYEQVVSP